MEVTFRLLLMGWLMCTVASTVQADDRTIAQRLTNSTIKVTTLKHPKTSVQWGRATGVVDAPFDVVLKVVQDYGGYAGFLPHFEKSRVLSQRGDKALVYLEAKIIKRMVTIWAQMKMQERKPMGNMRIIEGDMIKGNVAVMAARWELTPTADGKTLVSFQLIMDPDLPLVPTDTITYFSAKATKQTIQALRKMLVKAR